MTYASFGNNLVQWTEKYLTRREIKKKKKEEKQKKKSIVREWVEAILWALVIVILLQQFLFELYVIPTGSMIPTIEEGTRALVIKTTFGPEILPGDLKYHLFRKPARGEVIVFENPDPKLEPMGPFKKIIHKIIFLLTLTRVDIDADKYGRPKVRLLLKRVIGIPGERIRMRHGDVQILLNGDDSWATEDEIKKRCSLSYPVQRVIQRNTPIKNPLTGITEYSERFAQKPQEWQDFVPWRKNYLGWYIPENRFFPMGDNRDFSKDARWYGPVIYFNLIGKAFFSFWPFHKIGPIK